MESQKFKFFNLQSRKINQLEEQFEAQDRELKSKLSAVQSSMINPTPTNRLMTTG